MTGNPEAASSGDPGPVLAAFRRALAREMHVLRRHPGLLWQQLYNRLQWEDEPVRAVLAPEFERRSAPGAHTLAANPDAVPGVGGAGSHPRGPHRVVVNACAFSPDGTRVVSASWDDTLRLWDAETGQELRTLAGHTGRGQRPVPSAPTAPGWSRRARIRR